MDSIQVTIKETEPILNFVDKFSNGMAGRILSWDFNGYYVYTHFGKMFLREGDWLVYDGYAFIPYSKKHYEAIQSKLTFLTQSNEYWKQRCEAAEEAYNAAKDWWEKELSLEGFETLSKTFDRWQQFKTENQL